MRGIKKSSHIITMQYKLHFYISLWNLDDKLLYEFKMLPSLISKLAQYTSVLITISAHTNGRNVYHLKTGRKTRYNHSYEDLKTSISWTSGDCELGIKIFLKSLEYIYFFLAL